MHMHGPGRGWCKCTLEVYLKCGVVAAHSGMKVTQGKGHDARPSKGEELRITEEEGKPEFKDLFIYLFFIITNRTRR